MQAHDHDDADSEAMIPDDVLLAQGIAAAKAGQRAEAHQILTEVLRRNPESKGAWLWLGAVLDTPQGKAFCLRQVLTRDPNDRLVQRGLEALEKRPRATALIVQPTPPHRPPPDGQAAAGAMSPPHERLTPSAAVQPAVASESDRAPLSARAVESAPRRPSAVPLARRRRFWQLALACLGLVAFSLLAMLAYAMWGRSTETELASRIAALPTPLPPSAGTLRPTFTSSPTVTPTPTPTPTPTDTASPSPSHTDAPLPTDTPQPTAPLTATPTATRRRRTRPAPTATPTRIPTETPLPPAPPPRVLDPRLASLGVRIEPARVSGSQPHWYLVEARWADEREAAGKHNIFVEVRTARGERALGQLVIVEWADGSVGLPVEDRPPPDWAVDFGMYNTLGSYAVKVGGSPSDRIVGLGLGTAEDPHMKVHTCFYLVFRWVP